MPLKSYLLSALVLLTVVFSSCSKKKGVTAVTGPQEEGLKVSLQNVAEGQYTASPGPTYTFQVVVSSAMPAQGVSVSVQVVTDPGGIAIPQNAIAPSTNGTINVTLTGLEALRTVKVTVTITSIDNTDNSIVKSFYITNKSDE
jgi:hypothetical protein